MIKVKINGKEVQTKEQSILKVALDNGIDIPHFCYDPRMEAFGGCGMCVVEVEGSNKLVRSCSQDARDGMVITTHTDRTERARKIAMDLYISDHRGDCLPPCTLGCPANCDAQGYVGLIANNQPIEATKLIKQSIPIPSAIGRICPAPCETDCRRGVIEDPISIAQLKYFASDQDLYSEQPHIPELTSPSGRTVGVVGAGAAGLSIAYFLAELGHKPVVYEMMPAPGGMLRYGIPEYRLPNDILDRETQIIEQMGAEIHYNTKVGEDITLTELREKHDAVFLGMGAWKAGRLYAENENAKGVLGGIDFLRDVFLGDPVDIGDDVLVVGGGNTAMDVCRTAVRIGAKNVTIVYRRTQEYMPAQPREIHEAMEEGVHFEFLLAQKEVITDENGHVVSLRCEKMKLGEPDASGRQRPEGTGEIIDLKASAVIAAVGQKVDMGTISDVQMTEWGTIDADDKTYLTNLEGVFAGGDVVTGPKDAVDAVGAAKYAARVIDTYLQGEIIPRTRLRLVERHDMTREDFPHIATHPRAVNGVMSPEVRKTNFECMTYTLSEEASVVEADRCLECGCDAYYTCDLLDGIREYKTDTAKEYEDTHRRVIYDTHDFIELDNDKCIQCSLCVRVCDEVVGAQALGLVQRGYDGFVSPEFEGELRDTSCVSCGGCIEVCPTGAFREKQNMQKDIPLDTVEVDGVCTQCDLACEVTYHMVGDRIYKVTPNNQAGILCREGKFEYEYIQDDLEVQGEKPMNLGKTAILLSPVLSNEELVELEALAEQLNAPIYRVENNTKAYDWDLPLTEQAKIIVAKRKRPLNVISSKKYMSFEQFETSVRTFETLIYVGNKQVDLKALRIPNRIILSSRKELQELATLFVPLTDAVYYDCSFVKSNGETTAISKLLQKELPSNVSKLKELLIEE